MTNCLIEQPALADVLFQHDLNQSEVFLFAKLAQAFSQQGYDSGADSSQTVSPPGKTHSGGSGSDSSAGRVLGTSSGWWAAAGSPLIIREQGGLLQLRLKPETSQLRAPRRSALLCQNDL